MYLFDYARKSEVVLLHSRGNEVKQSPLIDSRPNLINLPLILNSTLTLWKVYCNWGRQTIA